MSGKPDHAKVYQRSKQRLALLHLIFSPLWLLVLMMTPAVAQIKALALGAAGHAFLTTGLFYLVLSAALLVAEIPFSFYSGFVLEHRYGLSNQKFSGWLSHLGKQLVLSGVLGLLLIEGLYCFIRSFPQMWWLYAWAAFAFVSYLLGKLVPVLIVPLFYRYGELNNAPLKERILRMVRLHGMGVSGVYSINLSKTTKKANAAFMGIGKTRRVVLSDTLLENFEDDEIEAVVAHELGHCCHRDIWRLFALNLVLSFLAFAWLGTWLETSAPSLGLSGPADLAGMPVIFLFFKLFSTVLMPLTNGFSRYRERAADRFALRLCAGKDAFISCMRKLGRLNMADPDPNPLYEWFFYDHPAINKRIRMAETFAAVVLAAGLFLAAAPARAAEPIKKDTEKSMQEVLSRRQRSEFKGFYLKGADQAAVPQASISVELYNEALLYFQSRDFDLAEITLREARTYDPRNPLIPKLLGEIYYLKHDLIKAKELFKQAYLLRPSEDLKGKLEKINRELELEERFQSFRQGPFSLKYQGDQEWLNREDVAHLLDEAYTYLSRDFGHRFKREVVVMLYDPEEFREIMDVPHWVGGFYDGKIRLPAYQAGLDQAELKRIIYHEMTHAFVADLAAGRAPGWINEGLAEYQEQQTGPQPHVVLKAAVKTDSWVPLDQLMSEAKSLTEVDPLYASLFYSQSLLVVQYLVDTYGMFKVEQVLKAFAEGKNSDEALRDVLERSVDQLEVEWREALPGLIAALDA